MARLVTHLRSNVVGYVALAIALGGGGGYALAATTNSAGGKRTACVSNKNGAMFLKRSTSAKCSKDQRKVIWNNTGPQGKTGAKGATGATGPAGPAGPAGTGAPGYVDLTLTVAPSGAIQSFYPTLIPQIGTIGHPSTGVYTIATGPVGTCTSLNSPVATPTSNGQPSGAPPVITIDQANNTIYTGYDESGGFTPADVGFQLRLACGHS
jgi:hypothetical protein